MFHGGSNGQQRDKLDKARATNIVQQNKRREAEDAMQGDWVMNDTTQ